MHSEKKRLARERLTMSKMIGIYCSAHHDSSGCYKPARKAQAREIMRYAGPKMLLRHPLLAIAHQLDGFRKARHPGEFTREQRLHSRKE